MYGRYRSQSAVDRLMRDSGPDQSFDSSKAYCTVRARGRRRLGGPTLRICLVVRSLAEAAYTLSSRTPARRRSIDLHVGCGGRRDCMYE
jgi:hypothetical protein